MRKIHLLPKLLLINLSLVYSFSISGSLFYTRSNYNYKEITANLEPRAFHFNYFSVLGSGTVPQAVRMIINIVRKKINLWKYFLLIVPLSRISSSTNKLKSFSFKWTSNFPNITWTYLKRNGNKLILWVHPYNSLLNYTT